MSGTWQDWPRSGARIPRDELDEATRLEQQLPRTLRTVPGDEATQRLVFDPAVKQYPNAYRATDPAFGDPARGEAWRSARRRAMDLVLTAIAASEWADSLVLRGSVLMSAWFGGAAREPGDLDFVVVPYTWDIGDGRTGRMLAGIAAAAQARALGEAVGISAAGAAVEDIWTYDRVPGRRMVLPWEAPGLPGGHIQLDFVFNERLPQEPEPVEVAGGAVVLAATPALSLAWKIMWLVDDSHAQGKDLYDAVLLAERYPLTHELLLRVFHLSGSETLAGRHRADILPADVAEAVGYVEWDHFVTEYPQFRDAEREFAERLVRALAPTFEGRAR
jgi:hypothetical protein